MSGRDDELNALEVQGALGRAAAAERARNETPAKSLARIASVAEEVLAEHRAAPAAVEEVQPFGVALARMAIRTCPDPSLIKPVPESFFDPDGEIATVRCPCGAEEAVAQGWSLCEGCGRGYLWTGSRLYAVSAPADVDEVDCPCDTVIRQGRRFVCIRCREAVWARGRRSCSPAGS